MSDGLAMGPTPSAASAVAGRSATRLAAWLALAATALGLAGLAAGAEGWSLAWRDEWPLVTGIRAPRTLGALLAGGCLGLAGAIAQGLFRNPLADPYLLGSAAGAGLGVTVVLVAGGLAGTQLGVETTHLVATFLWSRLGSNQRPSRCERDALPLSHGTARDA